MPTLGDLLDRLADDGDIAGFDAVFARAVDALDSRPVSVPMTPRRARRSVQWTAVVAIAAAAAIAVPLIVTRNNNHTTTGTTHTQVSTGPSDHGAVLPHVASATAAELAGGKWSIARAPFDLSNPDLVIWDGREVLVVARIDTRIAVPPNFNTRVAWAYDPNNVTWRRLPAPRLGGQLDTAVWTGHEVLAWTTTTAGLVGPGAAYDPVTQRWRPIAAPPDPCPASLSTSVLWMDTRALMFGKPRVDCTVHEGALGNRALQSETYDPTANRWRTDEVPSPQQAGETLDTVDAAYANGRVVARIDWIRPAGNGASLGHRVATLRLGDRRWTAITSPRSASAPVALDKGVAIAPGTSCTPDMSCLAGGASDGRWYPPQGASGPSIPPPTTQAVSVTGAVSTGGALVAGGTPLDEHCPYQGCTVHLSAWDLASNTWHQLPNTSFHASTTRLVWTGDALVWVGSTNGRVTFDLLKPAPAPQVTPSATVEQLQHFHWSRIPADPASYETPGDAETVWDGHEVLAWDLRLGGTNTRLAAYNPATNKWTHLRVPRVPAHWNYLGGTWTGNELVLLGQPSGHRAPPTVIGYAYDPRQNNWHNIATTRICDGELRQVVWDGSRVLVLPATPFALAPHCEFGSGTAYDPATNTWASLPALPVSAKPGTVAESVGGNHRAVVLVSQGGGNNLEPPATYSAFDLVEGSSHWARLVGVPTSWPGTIDNVITTGSYIVMPPMGGCAAGPDCAPGEQQFHDGYLIDANTGTVRALGADHSRSWNYGIAFTATTSVGSAIFTVAFGDGGDAGSPKYAYAWDAQGNLESLHQPGNAQSAGVWTGHELLFFDGPGCSGGTACRVGPPTAGWRFGP